MNNTIHYDTLANCSTHELHQCFTRAFGDYQVPMDMPMQRFQAMLARNGFVAKLSVGAFCEGQLVGFIFNGVRDYMNGKLAYDSGTAVLSKFRGQGIASRLLSHTFEVLTKAGINGYILECIKTNTKALALYEKNNFRRTRHFDCWQIDKEVLLSNTVDIRFQYQLEEGTPNDLAAAQNILSSYPSWQNSDAAIIAVSSQLQFVKLTDVHHKMVAFASWDPANGSVARLATWDVDAVLVLLQYIAQHSDSPTVRMVNVDIEDRLLPLVLAEFGFTAYVSQVEMFKLLY